MPGRRLATSHLDNFGIKASVPNPPDLFEPDKLAKEIVEEREVGGTIAWIPAFAGMREGRGNDGKIGG